MTAEKTTNNLKRSNQVSSTVSKYKWNFAWNPRIPAAVGLLSAVTLATALQVLVAGSILGVLIVAFAYFLSVHEVNSQYERVITAYKDTETTHQSERLVDWLDGGTIVDVFTFNFENGESPLGIKPSEQYRFNIIAITKTGVSFTMGCDFNLAEKERKIPLSNDFTPFHNLERVESNELGESGMVRFGVVDKNGNVFDFETAETEKAQDAAETIISHHKAEYLAEEGQSGPIQTSRS